MNIQEELRWDELSRIIRKVYGVSGHHDPGGAALSYIDRTGTRQPLCRQYAMAGSSKDDFIILCEAIVKCDLENTGIARQPGMKRI